MNIKSTLVAIVLFIPTLSHGATLYVSTTGRDGAAGTKDAPLLNLAEAAAKAQPGDVIRIAAGTYKSANPIRLATSGKEGQPIRIEPDDAARPLFDFSAQTFQSGRNGIEVRGNWFHIVGLDVIGAARNGINIAGHHNIIENCLTHENQDSGVQITSPASYNLILNCDSYRNVDRPTVGENADGFAAKFNIGVGNIFRGCRAWENADDGYDLWKAPNPIRIENCVAFRNGIDVWNIPGYTGNGNGFKLGGDYVPAAHVVIGCVATDQPQRGFDQNNNMGPLTIENCTAIRCKTGFSFTKVPTAGGTHVLKHNLAFDAPGRLVAGTIESDNQWLSSGGTVAPFQFVPATQPATRAAR